MAFKALFTISKRELVALFRPAVGKKFGLTYTKNLGYKIKE